MPGFYGVWDAAQAEEAGRVTYRTWRKQPTQTTGAGFWFDLSMSPGNPVPNYYIGSPGVFVPLKQSTDGGIPHGGNISPMKKYLRKILAMSPTAAANPLPMIVCDYLGFYGFIDESVTDPQPMTNSQAISRYVDGTGVKIMPVVVAGQTGGQTFNVTYTNQDGVTDRVTPNVTMCTQAVNGTILSSAPATNGCVGPFMTLQAGDTGVRSIESVQVNGVGDVGLFALVLVKPLASFSLRGADAPTEVDFIRDFSCCPEIQDDAYLNIICCPAGTLSGAPIHGEIYTVWN